MLDKLTIQRVRNLRHVELDASPTFNFIVGENGSGKTSVLEAIHILSTARSFRHRRIDSVIHREHQELLVTARLYEYSTAKRLGIIRKRGGLPPSIRIDGEDVRETARLAKHLPLLLLNAESFNLLSHGPVRRRAFLDWGVFHVEQAGFLEEWRRYSRALKQRNALLKATAGRQDLAFWTKECAEHGEALHNMRLKFLEAFAEAFRTRLNDLIHKSLTADKFQLRYRKGWANDQDLDVALDHQLNTDQERGFTQSGPHRAEIRISYGSELAQDCLSRGQLKILIAALTLAQADVLAQNGLKCVFLLDDIAAELDSQHIAALLRVVSTYQSQIFATAIDLGDLVDNLPSITQPYKVFHVKQGVIEDSRG